MLYYKHTYSNNMLLIVYQVDYECIRYKNEWHTSTIVFE